MSLSCQNHFSAATNLLIFLKFYYLSCIQITHQLLKGQGLPLLVGLFFLSLGSGDILVYIFALSTHLGPATGLS